MASPPNVGSQSELSSWLLGWFAGAAEEEKELMIQAAYGLWLARNDARDGKRIAAPHDIMQAVLAHMEEWRAAHAVAAKTPKLNTVQRWQPPDEGWTKVNSDGAVSKYGEKGGGGIVVRDHNGAFLAGVCHHYPHISDPEAVEVLACKRAIQVARELNVQKIHMELDSQSVVQMINSSSRNMSSAGPWIEEIKDSLKSFSEAKVAWVRRSANAAAHKLARVGVGDELCKVWFLVPPEFILDVIADEIPNFSC